MPRWFGAPQNNNTEALMSTPAPAHPRRPWLLPVVCVVLFALGLGLSPLWDWAAVLPAWRMLITHFGRGLVIVSLFLVLLWFFSIAGFSARLRVVGAMLLLLLAGTAVAAVRELDFYGDMGLILRFRWQPS